MKYGNPAVAAKKAPLRLRVTTALFSPLFFFLTCLITMQQCRWGQLRLRFPPSFSLYSALLLCFLLLWLLLILLLRTVASPQKGSLQTSLVSRGQIPNEVSFFGLFSKLSVLHLYRWVSFCFPFFWPPPLFPGQEDIETKKKKKSQSERASEREEKPSFLSFFSRSLLLPFFRGHLASV